MENTYEEGVITFSQLWRVCKKSFLRAVIYVVVCAIVCAVVLYGIRVGTRTKYYTTSLSFTQSDGTESYTSVLNTLNAAKSGAISYALSSDENIEKYFEDIYNTFTITPVVAQEYASDSSYISTSYKISFEGVTGLSSDKQVQIVQDIATYLSDRYCLSISAPKVPDALLAFTAGSYTEQYLDVIDDLSSQIASIAENMKVSLDSFSGLSSYMGTSASSATAYSLYTIILNTENTLSFMKQRVISFGIVNDNASLSVDEYATYYKNVLTNEKGGLQAQMNLLDESIKTVTDLGGSIETGGSSGVIFDTSALATLLLDLINSKAELQAEMSDIESTLSDFETYIENATKNSSVNSTYAAALEEDIQDVYDIVTSSLAAYNDIVDEYNTYSVPTSVLYISGSARETSEAALSVTLFLMILLVVIVIAYLVAYGMTWSAMKRNGTLNGDAPAMDKKGETEKPKETKSLQ